MAVMAVAACNNNPSTTSENDADPRNVNRLDTIECYSGSLGRDSAYLTATVQGNQVLGTLNYRFYEKDNSTGSFIGRMRIDTLVADYVFTAEGVSSTRQIVFLEQNGRLIEGYGEMREEGGKMIFKNLDSIKFGTGFRLTRGPCK
jgi:hypothetical protein